MREAALAGAGIAMLPAFRCAADIRAGRLHRVLDGWCSGGIQLSALYPSARHLAPKVKAFLDLLRDLEHDQAGPFAWDLDALAGPPAASASRRRARSRTRPR